MKNPERAGAASKPDAQGELPFKMIDPTVTAALISGMPAPHIALSVEDGLRVGNAAMSFKGRVKQGYIVTDWLNIAYPMPGAMGRELTLECSGYFEGDTVVSTATALGLFDQVYDQVVFKPPGGKDYRETIKLLIDTEAMAQPAGVGYRIVLTGDLWISRCTLDLAEA